jgi:hypothetical protein
LIKEKPVVSIPAHFQETEPTLHQNTTPPSPIELHPPWQLLWNNTNALQIENKTTLAKSINNYLKHEPTILGLIKTKQNF